MHKLMLSLAIVFSVFNTQGQGIEFFHGEWKDAIAKAKAEDKLLFVDAYAEWCGPCKAMAKNVFPQAEVGTYFNKNFISLKLDMEKTDGVSFGHKYPVSAFPTLFFIDGDGKIVKKLVGGQNPEGLIIAGTEAIKGNDKSGAFEIKYLAGDRSYDLVKNYVKALNTAEKPSLKICNDYLNSKPAITEDQRLSFLLEAATDSDSKLFDEVLLNKDKIISLVTEPIYLEKCKLAIKRGFSKSMEFEIEELLDQTMSKSIKALGKEEGQKLGLTYKMQFYSLFKNKEKYTDAYKALAKSGSKDGPILKHIATDLMKQKNDKEMLKDAADYIDKANELSPSVENISALVNIMTVANQTERAIKIVKKEREQAEKDKKDLAVFDRLLDYLNSKKV